MTTPPPPPTTIITRYGVDYCILCALAVVYCRCGTTPAEDEAARDGAESGLAGRVREAGKSP